MENNSYLEDCSDDDVLSFSSSGQQPFMYKVGNFRKAVKNIFHEDRQIGDVLRNLLESAGLLISKAGHYSKHGFHPERIMWFTDGVTCEILKVGERGWKTGKIRIRVSLEFCPDQPEFEDTIANEQSEISQPESPLDDLRRMMNNQNQS